jgi:phosphoglycerate dehydrogenase-like enzyme
MKGWENWKDLAEGIMVRGSALPAEDIVQFGAQLRFVAKHGVGVDLLRMQALKEKGIVKSFVFGTIAGGHLGDRPSG